jgi:hypothetical protein
MAISDRYRSQILARLPAQYRDAYDAGDISDEQLEVFAARIGLDAPADFSGVTASASSTEETATPESPFERRRRLAAEQRGGVLDALQSSFQSTGAGLVGSASRSDNPFLRAAAETAGFFGGLDRPNEVIEDVSGMQAGGRFAGELRDAAAQNRQRAELANRAVAEERKDVIGETLSSPFDVLDTAITDVAGSATSVASLIPGGAAVSMGDMYAQEYDRARAAGLSDENAKIRAASMASG